MMREDQPCDYTNYDVSGCAYSLDCHNLKAHSLKKDCVFLEDKFNILSREDLWRSHCRAALQVVSHEYLSIY